jgi:hypothetical protein
MNARPGFDASNWRFAPVFGGHCATPADVEGAAAVFALADTLNGQPIDLDKPAPVIWYAEDEEFAALVVQAEAHETDEDGRREVLGLLLPGGGTAAVFLDDVEFVAASDPVWRSLLEADRQGEQQDTEDGAEWAGFDLEGGDGGEPEVEVRVEAGLDLSASAPRY